ncbi:DoxX family protein [Pendulispora rubella]|uniref:DoxX family protein n=1 Tax=Pendulispora rubella TaxID=2741070 RepID=A0ABZ2KTN2_9BACT
MNTTQSVTSHLNVVDTTAATNVTATNAKGDRVRRYLVAGGRVSLGLVFFVCGLDFFLHFLPQPTEPMPEGVAAFAGALAGSGYLFQLIKGTEVLVGALLLANRFVPLALALIAPVVVNIFAFHAFLAPSGLPFAAVLVALEIALAWAYRAAYKPMLAARAR